MKDVKKIIRENQLVSSTVKNNQIFSSYRPHGLLVRNRITPTHFVKVYVDEGIVWNSFLHPMLDEKYEYDCSKAIAIWKIKPKTPK